jgi:cytochrome c-type biogenesis protein CcmH/NrfG
MAHLCIVLLTLLSSSAAQQGSGGNKPVTRPPVQTSNNPSAATQQPVFYVGKVVLDSGTAPTAPVAILRVCNGIVRRETFTGADGSFSVVLGDPFRDTATDPSDDSRTSSDNGQFPGTQVPANGQPSTQNRISSCELRAELTGYDSSSIRLDFSMNNSMVGIITLHSRTRKSDRMVTVGSLEVPPKARTQFEKGSELLEKGNFTDAERSLRKAIEMYPKFAEAWSRLGDLEQRRNKPDAARQDYHAAIDADPNLPLPYLRLAILDAEVNEWVEVGKLTDKVISLDPTGFPIAYYYNAVAEFYLDHIAKASRSALRAESLDKQHDEPRIELLLASICLAQGTYSAAATHYRTFLQLIPAGPLSDQVKTELARIEQLAKAEAPPTPTKK